jgi:hypothetical protein
VRDRIDLALSAGQMHGPDGAVTHWRCTAAGALT